MALKDLGKLKKTLQDAVDTAKTKVQDVKLPEIKAPDLKDIKIAEQVKKVIPKKEETTYTFAQSGILATRNALEIFYYLMAADGDIHPAELEKLDLIGAELDPNYMDHKDEIIVACKAQTEKAIDPEDYMDVLEDGIDRAIADSRATEDSFITPKLLVWDMLAIAYSDDTYDETERKLLKYAVRKLGVDKAVFLELESSIQTLIALEQELQWIKTTDRPYLTIESMVNEIADRKAVVFASVQDLIAL